MRIRHLLGVSVIVASAAVVAGAADSSLLNAVKNQDQPAAHASLQARPHQNVNEADGEGMTALLWAAHWDEADMVKCLIEAGANAKATTRFGNTALHEAANLGDAAVVTALLQAGADPNAVRAEGDTPLMLAARTGSADVVRILLDHGAAVDTREQWFGETPLMLAAAGNYPDVIKVLVGHGADVNALSTAFHYRRRPGLDATFPILPSMGGLTALHFAARQDSMDAAKALLAAGADINKLEPDSHFSPLLTAVVNNHYDMATLLIEKGANVNDGSLAGAVQMRNYPAVRDKGDGHFTTTPPAGSLELMKVLLQHGADINAPFNERFPYYRISSPRGANPLFIAAYYVDVPAIKLLVENGAHPIPLKNGVTPLMAVAAFGDTGFTIETLRATPEEVHVEAAKLLVSAGDPIDATNARGDTALHYAAASGNSALVQFLVDHGASLDAKTSAGRSPLDWAKGLHPGNFAPGGGGAFQGYTDKEREGLPHHDATAALIEKLSNHKLSAGAQ